MVSGATGVLKSCYFNYDTVINKRIVRNLLTAIFNCFRKASDVYKKLIILIHVETIVILSEL